MAKTAKTYGTKEAAQKIGVSLRTLNRWLAAGKLKPSHGAPYGGIARCGFSPMPP